MKAILDFFKNKIVISVIGLIVLSILIWFIGPHIKFGEDNFAPLGGEVARLMTIMVLIVLWGLNNLRVQLVDKKNNEGLVNDLQDSQGVSGSNLVSGQTAEEMHQINERFTHALSTLKKLKFRGRGIKKALYELPWYIIIGPPGSGKTTALINSSLEFPLADKFGKASLQGVGGTRNCDWWFTNEAVLIDTAGRYTTQDSHKVVDSSAWEGFLNLLKRHRRRRPINGAIIAISLQELLTQTEEERLQHAKTIRSRIDELMDKLEIRFPIYLMFTKCDLVSGFKEFFEDLSKEDREQVWGISLPNAPKPQQTPDLEFFDQEYTGLLKRLYDRVLWRVHQERDPKRRAAIQGFPQQMENLKAIIDNFVQKTFIKNRYRFQPYLRGVYFSSGTQDGTPIDRLMSSVSANFGFDRDMVASITQQGKSFFLGQLFRNVIFPESELVGSNRKYELIIRWVQRSAYLGMAGIATVMFIVWAGSFTRNEIYMHDVESYVAEYKAEKKRLKNWSSDIRTVLPALNALAKASIVYDQEQHPWLSGLGMYDGNVDRSADLAYESQLVQLLQPKLIQYLEVYLRLGHQGGDLYSTFRTYVMFKKLEHLDKELVTEWFVSKWDKQFQGEATVRNQLKSHLTAFLNLERMPAAELDRQILSSTRNLLLRVPVSKRIYERIRTLPKYNQKIDMLNEFGESVRATYVVNPKITSNLSVPLLFTIEGYKDIDFSSESTFISSIVNEKWLLEDEGNEKVDFIKDDLDEVSRTVKEHYLAEYGVAWQRVYESLDVKPMRNLQEVNDVLASFTDPVYSPLLAILQVGSINTQLTNPIAANLAEDNQEGIKGQLTSYAASKIPTTRVDKQFRELNVLMHSSAKRPAPIDEAISRIRQVQEFINEITLSPDQSKKAFEVAKVRYQSGSGNAISTLSAYAKTMPQPIKRWLTTLADESWKVVLQSAHGHVNAEWKAKVYTPYTKALAGRYPLSANSQDELAMLDFIEFFKPGGTIDAFSEEYIKPFITTRQGWQNRGLDNHSMGLSSKAIGQIQIALRIKDVFFRANPELPSMAFEMKPHYMGKADARFMLELGGNRISYSHGPKFWKKINWTGDDEHNRVRIMFEDVNEQQYSKTYDGPWAWFRLLGQSKLQKTRQSNVYLITFGIAGSERQGSSELSPVRRDTSREVVYEIKARSVNNPFKDKLISSFVCPSRI